MDRLHDRRNHAETIPETLGGSIWNIPVWWDMIYMVTGTCASNRGRTPEMFAVQSIGQRGGDLRPALAAAQAFAHRALSCVRADKHTL